MMNNMTCRIGNVDFGRGRLAVIAGPCVAESLQLCMDVAGRMCQVCSTLGIGYVFKASFDKANRSSSDSFRGPGIEQGLEWLAEVKKHFSVPVLTDVHERIQVAPAAAVVDCLQIPALLCRQTDLLEEAGRSGRCVNIKKGQFMAPWDMKHAAEKVRQVGNNHVLLTERGTSFGYNRLVTDFCSIPQMQQFAPVVFDATHSVQQPGGMGKTSGGLRQFVPILAQAAMAAGADALFFETHPQPDQAKCDGPNMVPLSQMEALLSRCQSIFAACRK